MTQFNLEPIAQRFCIAKGWTFVKRLGQGAFKQTFLITRENNCQQALKILDPEKASASRTQREIDAMLRCNHTNIAKLNAVEPFSFNSTSFTILLEEYLPGGTLTDAPAPALRLVAGQLVRAIAHLQVLGLIHRDIKPDNVMFRTPDCPVLVDFGIVKSVTDTSLTPTWWPRGPGTPFFASPEQLNNEKRQIDWRSDQFSLGVSIAFKAMGTHPYALGNESVESVLGRVAAREPLPQQFVSSCFQLGMPELVRMVAPWPVERFRTPTELIEAWE